MKNLFWCLLLLSTSVFSETLSCRIGTQKAMFNFKQEVDLSRSASFHLGEILEIDESLRVSPLHYPVIAKKDNTYVALWQKHPNLISVTVFQKIEGQSEPRFLSESNMIRSDELYTIYTTAYLNGSNEDFIGIRCDIK
ncbi:MAG: hypothetical protein KC478_16050 [Bacteriovoracaceae bacterium]|nr:hypothetical protein [Bacteriovoracaceae bacterium]